MFLQGLFKPVRHFIRDMTKVPMMHTGAQLFDLMPTGYMVMICDSETTTK